MHGIVLILGQFCHIHMIRSIIYQFIGSCKEFCAVEIRSVQPIKKYHHINLQHCRPTEAPAVCGTLDFAILLRTRNACP